MGRRRTGHGWVSAPGYAHDVPSRAADLDPGRLLDDLNDAQREAVQAVEGPVVILAAAGTGKTRVISRRTAYAIATGAVSAGRANRGRTGQRRELPDQEASR